MRIAAKCLLGLLVILGGLLMGWLPGLQVGQTQAASQSAVPANSAPRAVFPKLQWEFEPVMEGEEIRHDFIIENQGTAPLLINRVQPD